MGVCFHRSPAFGEHGEALLSYGLLIERNFYEVFLRNGKCPVQEYLSPQGPCWGTWRGQFVGIFERKEKNIWIP
jgi:hypothetical protein